MNFLETIPLKTPPSNNFYTQLYTRIKKKIKDTYEFEAGTREESNAILAAYNAEIASNPHKYQYYWNQKYCSDVHKDSTDSAILRISSWALISNGLTGHLQKVTFGGYCLFETLDFYEIIVTNADLTEYSTGFRASQRVLCEIAELHNLPTALNTLKKGEFDDKELQLNQKLFELTGMRI